MLFELQLIEQHEHDQSIKRLNMNDMMSCHAVTTMSHLHNRNNFHNNGCLITLLFILCVWLTFLWVSFHVDNVDWAFFKFSWCCINERMLSWWDRELVRNETEQQLSLLFIEQYRARTVYLCLLAVVQHSIWQETDETVLEKTWSLPRGAV